MGKQDKLQDHKGKLEFVDHRLKMFEQFHAEQLAAREACTAPLKVQLKDGKVIEGIVGKTTPFDVILEIKSLALKKNTVISKVNGKLWDLFRPIEAEGGAAVSIEFLDFSTPEGKEVFWHSSSHVLGESLERLFRGTLTVGPALDPKQQLSNGGFYYDMESQEGPVSGDHFKQIEKTVQSIVKEKQQFQRIELSRAQAKEMFKHNQFKQELIDKIPEGEKTTAYRCGPLIDLCRGPHINNTSMIKAMSVVKNSATNWMGKTDQASLQRVYGISFPDKKMLKEWKVNREKALANDHRDIGVRQKLFFFDEVSPGSCFWLPHGARIYTKLLSFMRKAYKERGYTEVISPNNYNFDLWKTSGHADKYAENMFQFQCDDQQWGLKPMNCPGHCKMFGWQKHSYREMPLRYADFGVLHRNELRGALTGLTRVRRFQQDDAHIFCREDQIGVEVLSCLDFIDWVYGKFGFKFDLELSTRPEHFLGEIETWDRAEASLRSCLDTFCGRLGKEWQLNPADGAFYGPKIDVKVYDGFGREHQCATVQLDFQLPERFELRYTDEANNDVRPVMIHRAILGSLERFIGILTEHVEGRWPFWVSPRQVMVVPVSMDNIDYARKVRDLFHDNGFHADVDDSKNKMNKKIALAIDPKAGLLYNYVLVVGAQEVESGTVNVRQRGTGKGGERIGTMKLDECLSMLQKAIANYE